MEATPGASLFLDSRSGFRPATAAEEVRTLFVARRPRAGSISWPRRVAAAALDKRTGNGGKKAADALPNSNYVVPLDKASCLTRPLAEILRDLNKRVPDKIINTADNSIPWYHTNRMLSFYAPGWCGEVCDVTFSNHGSVTVVYRVTIRGSDGEAHRESTGTVSLNDDRFEEPVAAAEEIAFCKACARFGFGLYLYHEDQSL
ncbi:DNA repair RAD52-like protein 2, chloroplastic [Phoenix dactylifera]|uniref:DNA repair RAD52-like protein 2, chloroplastic n=1 Tax=Phoenix dactylifera TaxID=42345 RepID=A0A8B7MWQ0_PHODC|nr:DNA repair RAD52-like protein 2, chloroplastic [Phoenix dactylifera]XP_038973337.1 DNA repair RAD52-like protein 2, chloroplastic [Phoenix dactylifera]